eukprot:1158473-Pelagomonas_calceolata.AAC.13
MANEQIAANGPGPTSQGQSQAIVVSDKAQQPNGEAGSQIVVSSEVRTGREGALCNPAFLLCCRGSAA